MLVLRVIAPVLETNCYVVAAGPGTPAQPQPALVIDPGAGAREALREVLCEHHLSVHTVALTHGHADHLWDAIVLADAEPGGDAWPDAEPGAAADLRTDAATPERPIYLGAPDRYRLADPAGALGPELAALFTQLTEPYGRRHWSIERGTGFPAATLQGGGEEIVPGVSLRAVPAPGHTEGSTVLLVSDELHPASHIALPRGADAPELTPVLAFTGDVLFAGSIGRTDLPGGDEKEMTSTLRTLAHSLPPHTVVLPGHGPASTLATERVSNPHLRSALG